MRASNRFFCSSLLTSSQSLISVTPPSTRNFSIWGHSVEEPLVLLLRAEAHDVLDAGAVVPAPIEDDDFASRGEMLQVALHVDLRLFAIGRRRQGHHPENARAQPLGQRADRPALTGTVAALEHDDDAEALLLDPVLEMAQPDLQLPERLLVLLLLHRPWSSSDRCVAVAVSARAELPDFRDVVEAARAGDKVELHVRRLPH